jgi:leucyl aminopeptidase
VRVEVAEKPLAEVDSDLLIVLVFDGDDLPEPLAGAPGSEDAKGGYKKTSLIHPDKPRRAVVVGLGDRGDFEPERARVAGAIAARSAGSMDVSSMTLAGPDADDPKALATAAVEGVILGSYRFDRYKSNKDDEADGGGDGGSSKHLEELTVIGDGALGDAVEAARVGAEAENFARELQDLPSNIVTPSYLSGRAKAIADEHSSVTCEVMGREQIKEKGMGGLVAVSQGTAEEPQLIVLRYEAGGDGETLGLVGKGVTFDSGGISIKPSGGMHEMKMDMSGAAAVLEAVSAIAKLGLAINILAIIPTTENMPSGTAVKPGDIITQLNGKTVEVNNTDAEGRLILADALAYSVELGADRIVDLATLTGAVIVALGSTYAGLISNDDDFAAEVEGAGGRTGELAWRLPLHPEYKDLTKGTVADLTNASAKRKASTIYAGSFLEEFVDGRPWVHLDIAGTAWDVGREYTGKGPSGFGTRLLIDLARTLSTE